MCLTPRTYSCMWDNPAKHWGNHRVTGRSAALDGWAQGYGYEVTGAGVWMAYSCAMKAAETLGCAQETKERICKLVQSRYSFVTNILGRGLGLSR